MAVKKSELYSSLWVGADALRDGMDASRNKNYVFVLPLLKYVSSEVDADVWNFKNVALLRCMQWLKQRKS
jgi:type I restriction-modification system DNA methylase subunit